ncbi:MAG: hypothetical protein F6J87_27705, partial [Spirulina sp. SIO3F2]|nr:hypothetical protein [Spirulina sp. SIO3F2]
MKRCWITVGITLLLMGINSPAQGTIAIRPEALEIKATRGTASVTRTLTINREQQIEEGFAPEVSESDTAATPLDIVPLDLERVD